MSFCIGCSPFISISTLSNKVVGNNLVLIPQRRVCNCGIIEDWLVVALDIRSTLVWYAHHPQFVAYSLWILAALLHGNKLRTKNTRLNAGLFFYYQYICAQFRYTMNIFVGLLFTVLEVWSLSAFALMVKPIPQGPGTLWGISSLSCNFPNSLHIQTLNSNEDSSMTDLIG